MDTASWVLGLLAGGFICCLFLVPVVSAQLPDSILPIPAPTPIAFEQAMSKKVFAYGELIPLSIQIQNSGDIPVNVSGVPPAVVVSIRKSGWDRGTIRTIPSGEESLSIAPHSNWSWVVPWDQKNEQGVQVDPGVYYFSMTAAGMNAEGEIIVLYPEGALEGSLSPQCVVTDMGIDVEVISLTLDEEGGFIRAKMNMTPPTGIHYSSSGPSQVTARYRIDNGPLKNFRDFFIKDNGSGTYDITWQIELVPCNAKDLTIYTTKIDPYLGRWNISISLDSISQCISANGTKYSRGNGMIKKMPASPTQQSVPLSFISSALAICICAGMIFWKGKRQ